MCPRSRILVTDPHSFGTARPDSQKTREIISRLVAKSNQENPEGDEGAEHNYHSRLLDPMEDRNACVFEGIRPCITRLLTEFRDEHQLWCMVGARGLRTLGLGHGSGLS